VGSGEEAPDGDGGGGDAAGASPRGGSQNGASPRGEERGLRRSTSSFGRSKLKPARSDPFSFRNCLPRVVIRALARRAWPAARHLLLWALQAEACHVGFRSFFAQIWYFLSNSDEICWLMTHALRRFASFFFGRSKLKPATWAQHAVACQKSIKLLGARHLNVLSRQIQLEACQALSMLKSYHLTQAAAAAPAGLRAWSSWRRCRCCCCIFNSSWTRCQQLAKSTIYVQAAAAAPAGLRAHPGAAGDAAAAGRAEHHRVRLWAGARARICASAALERAPGHQRRGRVRERK